MGNTVATSRDGDDFAEFDGIETLGYRILGVQPTSPASKAGLVSFFDFLLGANQQMLLGSGEGLEEGDEYDDVDFPDLLQANKGKVVELLVWNIKVRFRCCTMLEVACYFNGTALLSGSREKACGVDAE
jgi:GRASP55/65 PDZ-like domain